MMNRVPAWGLPALSALMLCASFPAPACATVVDFDFTTTVDATIKPLRALGAANVYIDPKAASSKLNGLMDVTIHGFYDTGDVETLGLSNVQTVSAHVSKIDSSTFGTVLVDVPSIAGIVPNLNYPSSPFLTYLGNAGTLVGINITTTKGGSVVLSYQANDVYNQYNGVEEDIFSPTTFVASLSKSSTAQYISLSNSNANFSLDALQVSNLYGTTASLLSGESHSFGAYTGDGDYYAHGADVADGVSNFGSLNLVEQPGGGTEVPSVPEPASWAMLIGGFSLVGAALRRRPKVATRVFYAA